MDTEAEANNMKPPESIKVGEKTYYLTEHSTEDGLHYISRYGTIGGYALYVERDP